MGSTTDKAEARNMAAELHHVLYEIKMLTRALLELSNPNLPNGFGNAWMESFAIHARNLNEFFGLKKKHEEYMRAVDFIEWSIPYHFNRKLNARASEQVAHLTFNRENPEKKTNWDFKG